MTRNDLTDRERVLVDALGPLLQAYTDVTVAYVRQLEQDQGPTEYSCAVGNRLCAMTQAAAAAWEQVVGEPLTMTHALAAGSPAGRPLESAGVGAEQA